MSDFDKLSTTLFGRTRRVVLALLYGHPDEAFYVREIIRMTQAGPGAVQRELQSLTDAGIIRRETRGRQVYYQADSRCPIFTELKSLAIKTAAAADPVRSALAALHGRILVAFIYGSVARNEPRSRSDLDVMIVGDVSFSEVVSALVSAQEALQREINPTVYSAPDFRAKVKSGHYFINEILRKKKVFLIGDQNELKRLGEEQVVGEAPSAGEIQRLLELADRDLKNSQVVDLDADWRLNIAYNAALQAATAALAASGYRASHETHHYRVIQSLAFTIGAEDRLVRDLDAFRKKRNMTSYELGGGVSEREAEEMLKLASELREEVKKWIRTKHPALLKQSGGKD